MSNTIIKITKEDIAKLPLYSFDGEIAVITDVDSAILAARELKEEKVLGFDTETKPSFKKGEQHKVAMLQLSSSKKAYIFRINQFDMPRELISILEDKDIVKAGVAIRDDIKDLQGLKSFEPNAFYEIQTMAKEVGAQNFGLRSMAALFLNIRVSKGAKLTNWQAPNLTDAQIQYAATDAWVGHELYLSIKDMALSS